MKYVHVFSDLLFAEIEQVVSPTDKLVAIQAEAAEAFEELLFNNHHFVVPFEF